MRHGKKFKHLSRKSAHRKAMLSNMATSLIMHKRISTTVTKAKELRKYIEPLITKSKTDSTHSRRIVFSYLKQKEAITELFSTVADKVAERPGGYTRIIKTGTRLGDNAETCIIELVDFNELYVKEVTKKSTRRRSRSGSKAAATTVAATDTAVAAENDVEEVIVEKADSTENEAPKEEAKVENTPEKSDVEEVKSEVVEEVKEEKKEEEVKEEKVEEKKEITEEKKEKKGDDKNEKEEK
ncbi:MAG: 50S ribosomal protein L17 [Bacteroidetes bacterium]|jgi:large subunit ribosomal protein L17|nr:50S ribosomal protein L17 [Bacteroidota bacterium]MBT5527893.1 50S ribosomal protein L17 [Cytophagia bacterium]MBT3424910.1 50S ribosomal protein L17 [Bacteroidota bacterium]MBT3933948.1 50S ribosomal protein L17 [Bacteroidota bacterium]MBT4338231.1 50S ribosomal protein L17 [Bacteroidota bacterium]